MANESTEGCITYQGYWYEYVHRLAKKGELCLATLDPSKYCNGLYSYSPKDPGDGMAFVVTDTNEAVTKAMLLINPQQ